MTTVVQLFSARNFTPWDRVLDRIAAQGYDGVEVFFGVFDDPAGFRAMLDARGLVSPTGHFPLEAMEGDFAGMTGIARTLGVTTIICPWLPPDARPTTRAGWQALGDRLHVLDRKVRAEGFGFAWHNHDFEFVPVEDGTMPQDILMDAAPGMGWEADLGWLFRAGQNPADWINKHRDRILAVHLKDVQPAFATAPESGWADLGHGVNDWAPVFAALHGLTLHAHVAEHDDPADLDRFLTRWKQGFDRLVSDTV